MNKEIHISAYNALLESLEDIETVKQKLQFQINNFDWIGTKNNKETITKRIEALELDKIIRYINLTFEHGQKIDELNKQNVNRFAEIKDLEHNIEQNKDVVEDKLYSHNKRIDNNKLNLDVFKSAQNMINERHFNHIKKLTRESMIMFFMVILLFVVDLATIWCYYRK